ncbi:DUF6497 family protein [Paracoccus aerodenitrificans]|uniref:DUF6497 family protein n=1 Tax=Paracoccus aerodenitrificans TaxID=3017781 RepID=UPI0022F135F6|nr:DUF6497 family protein [Paracoccus aerodenitrificans]WBU63058.1 DUF6497 family protein [Paracoccus aerodenitrificans]
MTFFSRIFLLALPALPVQAESTNDTSLDVPSGQQISWLDTIHGVPGPGGLTYRFRFVAPQLANLVPMGGTAPMEELPEADMALLEELAESEGDNAASILSGALREGLIGTTELDSDPVISILSPEAEGDLAAEPVAPLPAATDAPPLPPAPEILLQDPMHNDIVWLCENFVLPRIASPAPRPTQIVISLSDRPTPAGELTPGVVQLFEAFSLPPNRDECIWEPF